MQRLTDFFDNYSWNALINSIDSDTISVDEAFADFINVMHFILDNVVGYCTVSIRDKEPPYITPYIKLLLKKRNRLMHRGRVAEAEILANNIGKRIANIRANFLKKANLKDTKHLWKLVNGSSTVPMISKKDNYTCVTPDNLNKHFSKVATDDMYDEEAVNRILKSVSSEADLHDFEPYDANLFAILLSKLKPTSAGPDGIPYWLYRLCASQLSLVMSKLVNFSIVKCSVPVAWRTAYITPIPKTSAASEPADFRPISVTPIFVRLTEKLIVRDFLLPRIVPELFNDQYAFKPTGSTTCALIDLSYRLHMMLEKCKFVRCVFVDFSKAFDVVDHCILLEKLIHLHVPNYIVHWIKSFLSDRMQATKFNDLLSSLASINRSIVQGSGLGPVLFIMFAFDLVTLDELNYLIKYADDVTLLNPENATVSLETEIANIMEWARKNKMTVNMVKTKEMIFHRPNPKLIVFPNQLDCIERVNAFKLLGMVLKPDLNFNDHVSSLVTLCNQRLYLLSLLRKQGLGVDECDSVLQAIVLSRIRYALPMYYNYLTADMLNKINAIFHKAHKWHLTRKVYEIQDIAETMQMILFHQSKRSSHCLNHLYVSKTSDCVMSLRQRGHDYVLPTIKHDFSARNFIISSLFKFR